MPEQAPPGSVSDHHIDAPAHSRAGAVALDSTSLSNIAIPRGQVYTQAAPFVE